MWKEIEENQIRACNLPSGGPDGQRFLRSRAGRLMLQPHFVKVIEKHDAKHVP
jgi:hypothetical protein